MSYFDIHLASQTDGQFRHEFNRISTAMGKLEAKAEEGGIGSVDTKMEELIRDLLRLCRYNAGFLVPYFFPSYPKTAPLSLLDRPFSFAMFDFRIGGYTVIRASRQIGKSTTLIARQRIMAEILPKFRNLFIVPHQEHLDTYANRFREMERAFRFPVDANKWRQNLTFKEYPNGSIIEMLRLLTSATDSRGKTTDELTIDEAQQFDPDLLPELEQTQKSSKIKSTLYSGTSLSMDTFLETKYQDSSQGTWHIRSPDGTHWIDCGDQDQVLKTIKPAGPTCPYSGRLLDVTDGCFVHAQEDHLEAGRVGLHIPQIIIPEYANDPIQWADIYKSFLEYPPKKFTQEILGIPTEEGAREITLNDLKHMCCLPEQPSTLQDWARRGKYRYVISACDWGGSDHNVTTKTKVSYTVHVMMGVLPDGYIDIIYMRRYEGMNYREIAANIAQVHRELGGGPIASDNGVGAAYTLLLREFEGINPEQHIIFGYVGPNSPPVAEPSEGGWFNQLSLNRTESITKLYEAIRLERPRIRCYNWEIAKVFLLDFMNLFRVPTESALGVTTFRYIRAGSKADDTLHAVNFGFALARIVLGEPILEDRALRERLEYRLRVRSSAPSPGREWGGVISG